MGYKRAGGNGVSITFVVMFKQGHVLSQMGYIYSQRFQIEGERSGIILSIRMQNIILVTVHFIAIRTWFKSNVIRRTT